MISELYSNFKHIVFAWLQVLDYKSLIVIGLLVTKNMFTQRQGVTLMDVIFYLPFFILTCEPNDRNDFGIIFFE